MRFIHIADVHLGAVPDGNKSWAMDRNREIFNTFEQVIADCNQKRADLLLISGDLFHRQPLKRELKEINYLFSRLKNTQVVIIAGNHDYLKPTSYYVDFPWDEHVHFIYEKTLHSIYFAHLDTEVYGLSYHSQKITDNLYDQIRLEDSPSYRILLAHGGDDEHIPFRKERLMAAGFDYIALGHLHQPKIYPRDKMAYAGSTEPLCEAETGPHGYILGEITDEGTTMELIPIARRAYIPISLRVTPESTIRSLKQALTDQVEALGEDNIFLLTLTGHYDHQAPLDYSELEECGNLSHLIDKTTPDFDILGLSVEHSHDLIGKYMEALHQMPPSALTNKALHYGLRALLED